MRYEYFGLPGTGKSYLCRELIQYFASTGTDTITVRNIIDDQSYLIFNLNKLRYASIFLLTHRKTVWRVLGITAKQRQKSKRQQIPKLINLFAELQKSETEKGHVVIEQGILQAVWSLEMQSESSIANELMDEVLHWLPTRVVLVVPPDKRFYLRQLSTRDQGQSHFDALSEAEIHQKWSVANEAIQTILELIASKKGDSKVLKLVNNHHLDVANTGKWISDEAAIGVNA